MSFIKKMYKKLQDEAKENIPVAIKVVEVLKKIMESPVDDILISASAMLVPALPVSKINLIKDKIEKELPKILLELNLVNSIANIEDPNLQLQAILDALKLSSDDVKAEKYHTIASKMLVILSDGKITWGESVMFTEWYYQTYVK